MASAAKLHMGLREWILLVTLALLWSGSFFFAELVLEELPPLVTAAGQVTASSLLLLPLALIVDRPWELAMPGPLTWGALAALALASTALAYVIFFRILAAAGATNLLLVTLLIPPGAALLGGLFLGEVLSAAQLAGMGLIASGLLVIDGRLLRHLYPGRSVPLQPSSSTKASD